MKTAFWISLFLTIVGGINWGLIGLLGFDAVAALFGGYNIGSQIVYSLVGVAALTLALLSSNVILLSVDTETATPKQTRRPRNARRTKAAA